MAFKRSGTNWGAVNPGDFASDCLEVNVYYHLGDGDSVAIETIATTPVYDGEELVERDVHYNWLIPVEAIGGNCFLGFVDPNHLGEPVEYGPFDIISPAATTALISPATASVVKNSTRQFAVEFYAADGLITTDHAVPIWSVDAGGTINSSTGLFTAGPTVGGPHTVTATAAAVVDTATVNISAGSIPTGGFSLAIANML
jgi:hypothetical protein